MNAMFGTERCPGAVPQAGIFWAFGPPLTPQVAANRVLITRVEKKIQSTRTRIGGKRP
jgi:hypothetical protein